MKRYRRSTDLAFWRLFSPWPQHWLIIAAIVVIGGPWAGVAYFVARDLPKFWLTLKRRLEARARSHEHPTPRAIWLVQHPLNWRFRLLKWTGLLWLPKSVPLLGGDVLLLDLTGNDSHVTRILAAARLANPRTRRGRRMQRLVRVEAVWWLDQEFSAKELPHLSRNYAGEPILALDPPDEERALWHARLLARHSFREPRRATWRHERKARNLFHKLWGMHGAGEKYQKPVWNDLQEELNRAGVRM